MLLLIGELADKSKENKCKYDADRFKDKKKAKTNVRSQNLPQVLPISQESVSKYCNIQWPDGMSDDDEEVEEVTTSDYQYTDSRSLTRKSENTQLTLEKGATIKIPGRRKWQYSWALKQLRSLAGV